MIKGPLLVVCCTYPYNFTGIGKKSEKSGQKPKKLG